MGHQQIAISVTDGECPTHVFTPGGAGAGAGPWPAIILYMDAGGIRPALIEMATRLAGNGYVVLVPDLFYRAGPYGPLNPKELFASGDFMAVIGPLMATTDPLKAAADTKTYIAYLDGRDDVKGPFGTVGFCMGGGMAIAAAGTYPDRIAAVASFHGGRLATDQPSSPHLFAPKIEAELYIAAADNDSSYPPEMAAKFEKALDDAHVKYKAEVYEGAAHGWMKPDFPVYDEAAAERGWKAMLELFGRTLG